MNPKHKFELSRKMKLGVGRAYAPGQLLKLGSFGFLTLAVILGLNAINLYSNRPQTPTQSGQVLGATDQNQSADSATTRFIEYEVQKGETLFAIAQQFNHSWTTIATLNNLEAPFTLKPGQTLKIPKD